MNELNSSNHSSIYQISTPNYCCDYQDDLDLMITHLKTEIFEKEQNAKDYCALENKIKQLQNEIHMLSDQKVCLEQELNKSKNDSNISIADMRKENENLMNELNEKNLLNKKLYADNNNLYQVIENKACESENLKKKNMLPREKYRKFKKRKM